METHFFEWGRWGCSLSSAAWGSVRMKEAGARRDREIDERAAAFNQQGRALERQGQVLAELLRRTEQPPCAPPFPLPPDKGD